RHNAVKLLLFFDVGGSMDDHVATVETLFSAARAEFKHLEYYYFHNYPYEGLWQDNRRRRTRRRPTWEIIRSYGRDYEAIFVGDASMSPYEIAYPGGSVEHWNEEAGAVWLQRLLEAFLQAVWLNPVPREYWNCTQSIQMPRELLDDRMYAMTLHGLGDAVAELGDG